MLYTPNGAEEHPTFVNLGEFYSEDWNQWVDLYALMRSPEYNNGTNIRHISVGARFSDNPSDYHSLVLRVPYKNGKPVYKELHQDSLVGEGSIDGVREAIERILDLNLI